MATFTAEEVRNLQEGGNERAREYFLRDFDFSRQSLPDSSNPEKLRDFIKAVYVDKRYCGAGRGGAGGRSARSDDDGPSNRRDSRDREFPDDRHGRYDDRRDGRRGSSDRGSADFGRSDTRDGNRVERRNDDRRDGGSWGEDRRGAARHEDRKSADWERERDRRPDDLFRFSEMDKERERRNEDDRRDRRPGYRDYPESPPVKHISSVLGENAPPLRVSVEYEGRSNGRYEDDTPGISPHQRSSARPGSVAGSEDSGRPDSEGGHKRKNSIPLIDFNLDGEPAATSTQPQSEDGGAFIVANSVASSSATAGWATFDVSPPQGGPGAGGGEFDSFGRGLFAGSAAGTGAALGATTTATVGGAVGPDGSAAWDGPWAGGMNSANAVNSVTVATQGQNEWASFDTDSSSQVQPAQTPMQPQAQQWDTFGAAQRNVLLSSPQQQQQQQKQQQQMSTQQQQQTSAQQQQQTAAQQQQQQQQQQFQQVLQPSQPQQVQQQAQGVNLQRSLSARSVPSPTAQQAQTSSRPALPDEFFTEAYAPATAASFYGMQQAGRLIPGAQYAAMAGGMMSFANMSPLQAALPQLPQGGPYASGSSMQSFAGWASQGAIRGAQSFPPTGAGMMMAPGGIPQFAMGPGPVQGPAGSQMLMSPTMMMPGQGMGGMLPAAAGYMPAAAAAGMQFVGGGQFSPTGMQRVPYAARPSGAGNPFG
ncbi:hypothetical protein CBR_g21816 [Chara braunii]|uniref:Arf-GAP domain-containing protein n=1 Tax=Chara braunii TaxID=69332 RepID=A0A388JUS8_CHABU|nr:hypothetical protein CBR_g21816 [Chara braunii]|eukprot:GBG61472.1 hypothetical protein CBR_g21816 [Chara braunii]